MADIDNLKGGTKRTVNEQSLDNLRGGTKRVVIVGGGGSSLPDQTGHSGEFLTTDGTDASWAAVESLPSQTGQSGKFLTTDGTDASWSDKPLVNNATGSNSITIGGLTTQGSNNTYLGKNTQSLTLYGGNNVGVGNSAKTSGDNNVSIGYQTTAQNGSIQFAMNNASSKTNSDANTFKVANANGNFEIMSADGTIPAARHASLPAADGTYVLKLVIASGVPTLSWVAE